MAIANDPTGHRSTCTGCGAAIEEALLLKGLPVAEPDPKNPGRTLTRYSAGVPTWRTLDRGHACAVCPAADDGKHQPGKVSRHSAR